MNKPKPISSPSLNLAFVDPGLRKAPFFLHFRHQLEPEVRCLYWSTRSIVRGFVRAAGAPLFPLRVRRKLPAFDIGDAELRLAIGCKELMLRRGKNLKTARRLLAELSAFYDEQKVGAVLVWNGSNLKVSLAAWLAQRRGLPVIFAEHGYLPGTLQLDLKGVNYDSSLTPKALSGEGRLPPDAELDAALDAEIASHRAGKPMRVASTPTPAYLHADARSALLRRIGLWLRARRPWAVRDIGCKLPPDRLPPRFVLLPLQVRKDSQLILHSPLLGNDMLRLLQRVRGAIAQIDPTLQLVVKFHPSEQLQVQRRYADLPRRFADVLFLREMPMHQLLPRATAVVTINSTVGFEAFLYGKPVVTLGDNFYTAPGLVERVERLEELPDALRRALSQPVDTEQRRAFLRFVYRHFLTFGSYHDFSERSQRAVAARIRGLLRTAGSRAGATRAAA